MTPAKNEVFIGLLGYLVGEFNLCRGTENLGGREKTTGGNFSRWGEGMSKFLAGGWGDCSPSRHHLSKENPGFC